MADIKQIQVDGTTMDISVPDGKITKVQLSSAFQNILDEGYKYMGIAHTDDAEVTPLSKVFYIATEVGTYTNKGGIQVAEDEVAIIKYDGTSWSKDVTDIATKIGTIGKIIERIIINAGLITMPSLPTSDPGVRGALWVDNSVLKVSM